MSPAPRAPSLEGHQYVTNVSHCRLWLQDWKYLIRSTECGVTFLREQHSRPTQFMHVVKTYGMVLLARFSLGL